MSLEGNVFEETGPVFICLLFALGDPRGTFNFLKILRHV